MNSQEFIVTLHAGDQWQLIVEARNPDEAAATALAEFYDKDVEYRTPRHLNIACVEEIKTGGAS